MAAVKNQQVAEIFEQIADFLELKGENQFKVNAYKKAARTLEGLHESVADLARDKKLQSVPGIGKAIAEKIDEFLGEGSVRVHRELSEEFPPQILELMDVPGLGAKRAALLYRELRIGSVAELETAIAAGTVRELKGFGAKTEAKYLDGIRLLREGQKRWDLGAARRLAKRLLAILEKLPETERLAYAGSLRRGKETVGDLDLVCVSSSPGPVMEAFCAEGRVVVKGETKSSILVEGGFQVDLRVVPAASFGAAMQYFTGSQDHNIAMRGRAERRGMRLNEYCILDNETGQPIALESAEEDAIYQALGLPWIPPELRESGRELTAAVPNLLEEREIRGNLHTHSLWSDGHDSLEELAEEAIRRGYRYLAVTDHSRSLVVANGLSIERLLLQGEAIRALNERLGERLRLLWGTECDILADGTLDYPDEILAKLDIVVAAVHSSMSMSSAEMSARIVKALRHPLVSVLAHPSGRVIHRRNGYEADWDLIFKTAAETGVRLEINGSARRLDLSDVASRRARELGASFALDTDAHSLPEFDRMGLAVTVARRAGLGADAVLNTLELDALWKFLKRR